jgi:hypothetical protein
MLGWQCALRKYVTILNILKNWANSWWQCALSKYVTLLNIFTNWANVMTAMCPQQVRDPTEYFEELG